VPVHHVFMSGGHLYRHDVTGDAGGEGHGSGSSIGTVLGHEEGSTAGDALENTEEATATGVLGVGGHLDGLAHPGELARLGDDGVVVVERELEDRHGGADDSMLHDFSRAFR